MKQTRQQVRLKVQKTWLSSCYKRMWGRWTHVKDLKSWLKKLKDAGGQRDMEIKQSRHLGDTTRTHIHGCWKIREQTWSWNIGEQEVAKTYLLDRLDQRTSRSNVDHSQQTTCTVDECVLPPLGVCGPSHCKSAQINREAHEIQKEEHTNCGRWLQR